MERLQLDGNNLKQKKRTAAFATCGAVIIVSILLITSVWVSESARKGTKQAVDQVSGFYLEELAGRGARVVSDELNGHIIQMENALDILEDYNLESEETLRNFLGKVRKLYRVDKFALVDENGIVYTQHSTTSGLSRYSFLEEEFKEPVIRTLNLYGAKKQMILAMPVEDISFMGAQIKVCFIQINIADMLNTLTLQTSENETYCNLYYCNGESLTYDDFGYFEAGKNLFSALQDADMENGSDYEQLKHNFSNGISGHLSFNYMGSQEDFCYIPVEGTNWMLTILVRENVISDHISSISSDIMRHSAVQIVITIIVMLGVFSVLIYQSREASRILLEQEKANGARIRAAYNQIERERADMENIHAAMGSG